MICRKQPWHQDNQQANFIASLSVSVQTFHRTLLNRSIIPFRQMGYNERGWYQFSTVWLLRFWFHCGPVNNPKDSTVRTDRLRIFSSSNNRLTTKQLLIRRSGSI